MHCLKATQQLQLYIDKQLTLKQIRTLEAHLSICTTCQNELFALEATERALQKIELVAEPADLTTNIMRRVALSPRRVENPSQVFFRPSFSELMGAVGLATIATLGVILGQPSLRAMLPFANILASLLNEAWAMMINVNTGTLMLGFWVVGAALGVWITLVVAGAEIRSEWFKAVMDRLPVW